MSEPKDPPRWSEGGAAPAQLSSLFSAAREDGATDADLSELSARLGPLLDDPKAAPLPKASPLLLKLAVGALVAGSVAGGVWLLRSGTPTPAAKPSLSSAEAPGLSSAANVTPPEAAPNTPAAPPASIPTPPAAEESPPAVHASNGKKSVSSAASEPSAAEAEASLLERARSALSGNPGQALALTAEHARRFPHGLLTQEREVIAISALRHLGRTAEADKRAARFDQQYPNSAHQHVVDSAPSK